MKICNTFYSFLICSIFGFTVCACSNKSQKSVASKPYTKVSPEFNADSAYLFVDKQVAFGPRVPNTAQHIACGDFLSSKLKEFGAVVTEQKMILSAYDGTKLNARNIIGTFAPDMDKRILLFAHWDSRPFADHDSDRNNFHTAIPGANDGASGVGVLLEIARILNTKKTNVGVDIIFFDAEDYGTPDFVNKSDGGEWWCLGSQYWAKNPHIANYRAKYGILLDMVGAADATFYYEYGSKKYASGVLEKVWSTARQLGYGNYFISSEKGGVTDDHIPVNQFRKIPSIDIIDYKADAEYGFFPQWHTIKDDMDIIDKNTLKAVGQTLLEVIYKEKP